jgi:hypothetical protein
LPGNNNFLFLLISNLFFVPVFCFFSSACLCLSVYAFVFNSHAFSLSAHSCARASCSSRVRTASTFLAASACFGIVFLK